MRNLIWEKYEIERAMLTFIFIVIFYVSFTAFKSIWNAFYRMEMMVLVHAFFIAFFNGGMLLMQNRAPTTKYAYVVPSRVFFKGIFFNICAIHFMTAFLNVIMVL